jgi:hypothetical protein
MMSQVHKPEVNDAFVSDSVACHIEFFQLPGEKHDVTNTSEHFVVHQAVAETQTL